MNRPTFPKNFRWGAATSAYQIEGAWDADGKGPSIWDQMVRWPGKIAHGDRGDVAGDHYHRLEEDLDLMSGIGLKAYRFSFSWPRILPEGTGETNEAGLAFYDRLIDGLLARNIEPWATAYHWCLPLALHCRGGWLNADSPRWFEDYIKMLAGRFGDRVRHWITLNEPQIFVGTGYGCGIHAPGLCVPESDLVRVIHNVLCAHGRAVIALRELISAPMIGWASAVGPMAPDAGFEQDAEVLEAARAALFHVQPGKDSASGSAIWADPIHLGSYPEAFLREHAKDLPPRWEQDLQVIHAPLDFCGMNIYGTSDRFARDAEGKCRRILQPDFGPGFPRTYFGWPVTPECLYWGPRFYHERYEVPIVITENGMSGLDWVALDGHVHDPARIDFLSRYLAELRRAITDGVDVLGYFHWSLMDNFEWADGFRQRFGLIHVDYRTGKRTPKDSARWYRQVIEHNGASIPIV